MPKQPRPSTACSPRRTRRSRLVSPVPSLASHVTRHVDSTCSQNLFSASRDILPNRIDASLYSRAQLQWWSVQDQHRYNTCLDFSRCEDTVVRSLFPSKHGGSNRVPLSHKHTPMAILQYQKLGNQQQQRLLAADDDRQIPPFTSDQERLPPCLGL